MNQQFCANCGKGSAKDTHRESLENDETYQGNQQIIRSKVYQYGDSVYMGGRKISKVTELTLWDGESYERFRYGHFCTLRCAEHFANDAVKAGYRRGTDD
tara:strand:+ start:125 stop:424 length:300 start_codon:yes stop_codon:yes gene_type:complete